MTFCAVAGGSAASVFVKYPATSCMTWVFWTSALSHWSLSLLDSAVLTSQGLLRGIVLFAGRLVVKCLPELQVLPGLCRPLHLAPDVARMAQT